MSQYSKFSFKVLCVQGGMLGVDGYVSIDVAMAAISMGDQAIVGRGASSNVDRNKDAFRLIGDIACAFVEAMFGLI